MIVRRYPSARRTGFFMLLIASAFLFLSHFTLTDTDLHVHLHSEPPSSSNELAYVLEQLLPDPTIRKKDEQYKIATRQGIRRVVQCIADHGAACKDRPEGKVVILEYLHFRWLTSGSTTGEVIWCESVVVAMQRLGYTVLTVDTPDEALQLYRVFPELVRVLIMQVRWGQDLKSNFIRNCFNNSTCILSRENPNGIAPWKMFGLTFWGTRGDPLELHHPYGPSRVLAPYKYPDHFWLGFAIDHHCTKLPVIPTQERSDDAFILAKKYSYFYDKNDAAFGPETWKPLAEQTGMRLISSAIDHSKGAISLPAGITGLGKLTREDFYKTLGSSKVLIGNGLPILSPSPLDALCIGVPFVHPYLGDRPLHPEGWDKFRMKYYQHGPLLDYGPPLVYHVKKGDTAGLIDAVNAAKANPIKGRGLPEEYTMASLMERVKALVETDWESRARSEGHIP